MTRSVLKGNHIFFNYPQSSDYALKNVSFHVYHGEWLSIVGHNGSGKSTLAKLLNGLYMPIKGSIQFEDDFLLSEKNVWQFRRRVGMVFQNPDNQFVGSTVKDDVAFGLENNGIPHEEMYERVHQAIQQVGMEEFLDQEPHQLSGGQKQRVAIAGVLALKPDIIVLDESTSMLDPIGKKQVIQTVNKLRENKQITVISITHDLEEAVNADRIIVMNAGEIEAEGTPEDIFKMDKKLINIGLDLPFSVLLSKKLREIGIPLTKNYLKDEEIIQELWTLKQKV